MHDVCMRLIFVSNKKVILNQLGGWRNKSSRSVRTASNWKACCISRL